MHLAQRGRERFVRQLIGDCILSRIRSICAPTAVWYGTKCVSTLIDLAMSTLSAASLSNDVNGAAGSKGPVDNAGILLYFRSVTLECTVFLRT